MSSPSKVVTTPLPPPSIEITLAGEGFGPDEGASGHQSTGPTLSSHITNTLSDYSVAPSFNTNQPEDTMDGPSSLKSIPVTPHPNGLDNHPMKHTAFSEVQQPPIGEPNQLGPGANKGPGSINSNDSESDEVALLIKDLNRRYRKQSVDNADFFTPQELRRGSLDGSSTASSFLSMEETWRTESSAPLGDRIAANPVKDHATQLGTDQKTAKEYDPDIYRLQMKQKVQNENLGLPTAGGLKFRWIHIPANNMVWVRKPMVRIICSLDLSSVCYTKS
jgi:hypothetical protein